MAANFDWWLIGTYLCDLVSFSGILLEDGRVQNNASYGKIPLCHYKKIKKLITDATRLDTFAYMVHV